MFLLISADKAAEKVLISEVHFLNGVYKHNDKPITGEIIDYYENDILKFTYTALEGRLHGNAIEYFESGKVRSERNYTFNKLFGKYTEYFDNGDTRLEFVVGLNAYGKGELVSDIKIAKAPGKKPKEFESATLIFIENGKENPNTSEELSILKQSNFKIIDDKGKVLFQH